MVSAFKHLAFRSWYAMMAAMNANTLGFLLSVFGIAFCIWMVGFGYEWWTVKSARQGLSKSVRFLLLDVTGTILFIVIVYPIFVVRTVYYDHTGLRYKIQLISQANLRMVDPSGRDASIVQLKKELSESNAQLEVRKQTMVIGDPSFDNMRKVLGAFTSYRYAVKGQKCFVYLTSPKPDPMVMIFSELSNAVSGCFTSSSWGQEDTDAAAEVKDGMIPGKVLVHGPRGDMAIGQVEADLSSVLPVERSYKTLSPNFPHYQNRAPGDLVLWLQFGPDVHWNSERSGGRR